MPNGFSFEHAMCGRCSECVTTISIQGGMLTEAELREIGRARLGDAKTLYRSRRYDGAIYLCGYAVELLLKARICKTLKLAGYSETRSEFQKYLSFRIHDLDILLSLSGVEGRIKGKFLTEWSVVNQWNPEARYKRIGSVSREQAQLMIESTRALMGTL